MTHEYLMSLDNHLLEYLAVSLDFVILVKFNLVIVICIGLFQGQK